MIIHKWLRICLLAGLPFVVVGCARSHVDTHGFAHRDALTVPAPFDDAWQATKTVLREKGLNIYTRDTSGTFVAYSEEVRRKMVPHRTQYTLQLDEERDDATTVTVETLDQIFGVTLLTYPGWHDRKTKDNSTALDILEAIYDKVSPPN